MRLVGTRTPLLRRFGLTGLTFPEVGLSGPAPAGPDYGPVLGAAAGLGIRFFAAPWVDSPPPGTATAALLAGTLPAESFVALRVGADPAGTATAVAAATEQITGRLGGRPLDLLVLAPPLHDRDLVATVARLKHRGAVRTIGLAIAGPADLPDLADAGWIDAVELAFNALHQKTLLACEERLRRWGGAVVVRRPLDGGLLADAPPADTPPADTPSTDTPPADRSPPGADPARRAAARELAALLGGDRTPAQAAMRVALLPDVVSVVAPRCRTAGQVAACVAASREVRPLSRAELKAADRIVRAYGLPSGLAAQLRPPLAVRVVATVGRTEVQPRAVTPARDHEPIPAHDHEPAPRVLSAPLRLGGLLLRNRIVRSGTTERAVDDEGLPTEAMTRIHRDLAAGGAGLVITGYLAVARSARASASHCTLQPGAAVPAWARVVAACRAAADTKLCAQLGHGGMLALGGFAGGDNDEDEVVRRFTEAAYAAAEAGFDAVQLHAAHGYLLGQLAAQQPPLRLRQPDHQGMHLVLRIVDAVCDAVQPDLTVLVKANISDFVPGGYDVPDAVAFSAAVAGTRIAGIEWSGWTPASHPWQTPSRLGEVEPRSEGFFVPFAAGVKARHPHLAIGTCGGFRSVDGMARAIAGYGLDFVSLARPLIAEPDLPNKILAGAARAFCDGCNQCLAKAVRPVHCPRLSHASTTAADGSVNHEGRRVV